MFKALHLAIFPRSRRRLACWLLLLPVLILSILLRVLPDVAAGSEPGLYRAYINYLTVDSLLAIFFLWFLLMELRDINNGYLVKYFIARGQAVRTVARRLLGLLLLYATIFVVAIIGVDMAIDALFSFPLLRTVPPADGLRFVLYRLIFQWTLTAFIVCVYAWSKSFLVPLFVAQLLISFDMPLLREATPLNYFFWRASKLFGETDLTRDMRLGVIAQAVLFIGLAGSLLKRRVLKAEA